MSPELRCGHASDVRGWSAMAARGCEILGQWDSGDGQNLTQTPAGVRLRGGGRPADRSPRNPTSRWANPLERLPGWCRGPWRGRSASWCTRVCLVEVPPPSYRLFLSPSRPPCRPCPGHLPRSCIRRGPSRRHGRDWPSRQGALWGDGPAGMPRVGWSWCTL